MRSIIENARMIAAGLRNAVTGANLAAMPLVLRPYQFIRYSSEARFLLKAVEKQRGVVEASIAQGLGFNGALPIEFHSDALDWGNGVASYTTDIISLCTAARILRPATVFEIGTLNGFTTYHLALNAGPDAKVYTLDLPPDQETGPSLRVTAMDQAHIAGMRHVNRCVFDGTDQERKIQRLYGDSATFDFSNYHDRVDLFFIDGAHSYEYVRSDTINAVKCCRPGGVVMWHDFGRTGVNGVTRCVHELRDLGGQAHAIPGGSIAYLKVDDALKNSIARL